MREPTPNYGEVEAFLNDRDAAAPSRRPHHLPAEEYQRTLAVLQATSLRLRRIVESLLFLARADAEAALPEQEPIELTTWLDEHLQSWSEHARFGDITMYCPETKSWFTWNGRCWMEDVGGKIAHNLMTRVVRTISAEAAMVVDPDEPALPEDVGLTPRRVS